MLALFLFTDEKIYTVTTPKIPRMTDCTHINQPQERRRDKALAHIINVQSLTAVVGE